MKKIFNMKVQTLFNIILSLIILFILVTFFITNKKLKIKKNLISNTNKIFSENFSEFSERDFLDKSISNSKKNESFRTINTKQKLQHNHQKIIIRHRKNSEIIKEMFP